MYLLMRESDGSLRFAIASACPFRKFFAFYEEPFRRMVFPNGRVKGVRRSDFVLFNTFMPSSMIHFLDHQDDPPPLADLCRRCRFRGTASGGRAGPPQPARHFPTAPCAPG